MAPTPRAAVLVAVAAASIVVIPPPAAGMLILGLLTAFVIDALLVRSAVDVKRSLPLVMSRGVAAPFRLEAATAERDLLVRQPAIPDVRFEPQQGAGAVEGVALPVRRGRHTVPGVASAGRGPLGLGRWFYPAGSAQEVLVYPDLPAARRIALAVREGRFGEPGRMTRGPLGLGTQFESIRDYLPDDDIRQVNWRATSRLGRPMSNQYRVEQDRDVLCVVDTGRLMGAPLDPSKTRLDAALDASVALGLTADVVGDRCGAVAFDSEVRRHLSPHRAGGHALVRSLFDLEPSDGDSDYEMAFSLVGRGKRSFVIVFTDLIDESAASSLLDGIPFLARRHSVAIASVSDPDLHRLTSPEEGDRIDPFEARVARHVLRERSNVVARLRRAGATVIEATPERFSAACVGAYLRAKRRGRF
jgi:uncharacterized protein (DUF58 family)